MFVRYGVKPLYIPIEPTLNGLVVSLRSWNIVRVEISGGAQWTNGHKTDLAWARSLVLQMWYMSDTCVSGDLTADVPAPRLMPEHSLEHHVTEPQVGGGHCQGQRRHQIVPATPSHSVGVIVVGGCRRGRVCLWCGMGVDWWSLVDTYIYILHI